MPKNQFVVSSFAKTDVGRRRAGNEDFYLRDDELGLWLVADGMGGHKGGEVASRESAEAVFCEIKRAREQEDWTDERVSRRIVERAVQAATYFVYGIAEMQVESIGMGTTLSAVVFVGDYLVSAQVGDSRIYLARDGELSLLTEDHTLVNWQLKRGMISGEQAKQSRKKNVITRAVGHRDYVEVDTAVHPIRSGDRFLLCSDGLHGYVDSPELGPLLEGDGNNCVETLVRLANERGGKDNITAVLVEFVSRAD